MEVSANMYRYIERAVEEKMAKAYPMPLKRAEEERRAKEKELLAQGEDIIKKYVAAANKNCLIELKSIGLDYTGAEPTFIPIEQRHNCFNPQRRTREQIDAIDDEFLAYRRKREALIDEIVTAVELGTTKLKLDYMLDNIKV